MPTKQKSVLQLGAGRLMCHSIRKLKEINLRVIAADGAADAPGFAVSDDYRVIDIRDSAAVARLAHEHGVDLILAVNEAGVLAAAEASRQV